MNTFQKSQAAKVLACYITSEELEDIKKAQPVGTINKYGYKKQADGTWKYVGKGKTAVKHKEGDENQFKEAVYQGSKEKYRGKLFQVTKESDGTNTVIIDEKEGRKIANVPDSDLRFVEKKSQSERKESSEKETTKPRSSESDQRINLIEKLIKQGFSPEEARERVGEVDDSKNSHSGENQFKELVGETVNIRGERSKIKNISQDRQGGQFKLETENGKIHFTNKHVLDKLKSGKTHRYPKNPYSKIDDSYEISIESKSGSSAQ